MGGARNCIMIPVLHLEGEKSHCFADSLRRHAVCGYVWDVWKWGQVEGVPPAYLLYTRVDSEGKLFML